VPTDTPSGDARTALAALEAAIRAGDARRIKEAMDSLGRISIEVRCTLPATPRDRGEIRQGDRGGSEAAAGDTPPAGASDTPSSLADIGEGK
jgi:hypothetical protein